MGGGGRPQRSKEQAETSAGGMTDDNMPSDSAPLHDGSMGGSESARAAGTSSAGMHPGGSLVPSGATHYPKATATHEQLCADSKLFFPTLMNLLNYLGLPLKVPKIGGQEVDLHRLYKEVTKMHGLERVMVNKLFVQVCEPFNFPASFTNKSFVMRKLYCNVLHHFEQLYYHRMEFCPLVPPPVSEHHQAPRSSRGGSPSARRAAAARTKSTPNGKSTGTSALATPRGAGSSAATGSAATGAGAGSMFQQLSKTAVSNLLNSMALTANGGSGSPMQSPSTKRKQSDSTASPPSAAVNNVGTPGRQPAPQTPHHLAGSSGPVGPMMMGGVGGPMMMGFNGTPMSGPPLPPPPPMGAGGLYGSPYGAPPGGLSMGFKPLLAATRGNNNNTNGGGGPGTPLGGATGARTSAPGGGGGADLPPPHASPTTSCNSGAAQVAPPVLAPPGLQPGVEFPCRITAVFDNFYIIAMKVPGLESEMLGQLMIALPPGVSMVPNMLPHQLIYEPKGSSGQKKQPGGGFKAGGRGGVPPAYGVPRMHPLGLPPLGGGPMPMHPGMGMPPGMHLGDVGSTAGGPLPPFHHLHHGHHMMMGGPNHAAAGAAGRQPARGGGGGAGGTATPPLDVDELEDAFEGAFPDDLIAFENMVGRDWEPYPPALDAAGTFELGLGTPRGEGAAAAAAGGGGEESADASAAVTAQYSPGAQQEAAKKLRLRSNGGYAVVGGGGAGGGALGEHGWPVGVGLLRTAGAAAQALGTHGAGTPTALLDNSRAAHAPEFLIGVEGALAAAAAGEGEEQGGVGGEGGAGKAAAGAGADAAAGGPGLPPMQPMAPRSPFTFFVASLVAEEGFHERHGGRAVQDVAAELWEGMGAEERAPYQAAANRDHERHASECARYNQLLQQDQQQQEEARAAGQLSARAQRAQQQGGAGNENGTTGAEGGGAQPMRITGHSDEGQAAAPRDAAPTAGARIERRGEDAAGVSSLAADGAGMLPFARQAAQAFGGDGAEGAGAAAGRLLGSAHSMPVTTGVPLPGSARASPRPGHELSQQLMSASSMPAGGGGGGFMGGLGSPGSTALHGGVAGLFPPAPMMCMGSGAGGGGSKAVRKAARMAAAMASAAMAPPPSAGGFASPHHLQGSLGSSSTSGMMGGGGLLHHHHADGLMGGMLSPGGGFAPHPGVMMHHGGGASHDEAAAAAHQRARQYRQYKQYVRDQHYGPGAAAGAHVAPLPMGPGAAWVSQHEHHVPAGFGGGAYAVHSSGQLALPASLAGLAPPSTGSCTGSHTALPHHHRAAHHHDGLSQGMGLISSPQPPGGAELYAACAMDVSGGGAPPALPCGLGAGAAGAHLPAMREEEGGEVDVDEEEELGAAADLLLAHLEDPGEDEEEHDVASAGNGASGRLLVPSQQQPPREQGADGALAPAVVLAPRPDGAAQQAQQQQQAARQEGALAAQGEGAVAGGLVVELPASKMGGLGGPRQVLVMGDHVVVGSEDAPPPPAAM